LSVDPPPRTDYKAGVLRSLTLATGIGQRWRQQAPAWILANPIPELSTIGLFGDHLIRQASMPAEGQDAAVEIAEHAIGRVIGG
jgi:hypothetical protein